MFVRFFRILAGVTEIRRNKFPLSIFRESNQEAIDHWKKYVWLRLKKQKIEDAILILWDESVFSLHSNRRLAWSDIDVTIILLPYFRNTVPVLIGVASGGAVLASCEGR